MTTIAILNSQQVDPDAPYVQRIIIMYNFQSLSLD